MGQFTLATVPRSPTASHITSRKGKPMPTPGDGSRVRVMIPCSNSACKRRLINLRAVRIHAAHYPDYPQYDYFMALCDVCYSANLVFTHKLEEGIGSVWEYFLWLDIEYTIEVFRGYPEDHIVAHFTTVQNELNPQNTQKISQATSEDIWSEIEKGKK